MIIRNKAALLNLIETTLKEAPDKFKGDKIFEELRVWENKLKGSDPMGATTPGLFDVPQEVEQQDSESIGKLLAYARRIINHDDTGYQLNAIIDDINDLKKQEMLDETRLKLTALEMRLNNLGFNRTHIDQTVRAGLQKEFDELKGAVKEKKKENEDENKAQKEQLQKVDKLLSDARIYEATLGDIEDSQIKNDVDLYYWKFFGIAKHITQLQALRDTIKNTTDAVELTAKIGDIAALDQDSKKIDSAIKLKDSSDKNSLQNKSMAELKTFLETRRAQFMEILHINPNHPIEETVDPLKDLISKITDVEKKTGDTSQEQAKIRQDAIQFNTQANKLLFVYPIDIERKNKLSELEKKFHLLHANANNLNETLSIPTYKLLTTKDNHMDLAMQGLSKFVRDFTDLDSLIKRPHTAVPITPENFNGQHSNLEKLLTNVEDHLNNVSKGIETINNLNSNKENQQEKKQSDQIETAKTTQDLYTFVHDLRIRYERETKHNNDGTKKNDRTISYIQLRQLEDSLLQQTKTATALSDTLRKESKEVLSAITKELKETRKAREDYVNTLQVDRLYPRINKLREDYQTKTGAAGLPIGVKRNDEIETELLTLEKDLEREVNPGSSSTSSSSSSTSIDEFSLNILRQRAIQVIERAEGRISSIEEFRTNVEKKKTDNIDPNKNMGDRQESYIAMREMRKEYQRTMYNQVKDTSINKNDPTEKKLLEFENQLSKPIAPSANQEESGVELKDHHFTPNEINTATQIEHEVDSALNIHLDLVERLGNLRSDLDILSANNGVIKGNSVAMLDTAKATPGVEKQIVKALEAINAQIAVVEKRLKKLEDETNKFWETNLTLSDKEKGDKYGTLMQEYGKCQKQYEGVLQLSQQLQQQLAAKPLVSPKPIDEQEEQEETLTIPTDQEQYLQKGRQPPLKYYENKKEKKNQPNENFVSPEERYRLKYTLEHFGNNINYIDSRSKDLLYARSDIHANAEREALVKNGFHLLKLLDAYREHLKGIKKKTSKQTQDLKLVNEYINKLEIILKDEKKLGPKKETDEAYNKIGAFSDDVVIVKNNDHKAILDQLEKFHITIPNTPNASNTTKNDLSSDINIETRIKSTSAFQTIDKGNQTTITHTERSYVDYATVRRDEGDKRVSYLYASRPLDDRKSTVVGFPRQTIPDDRILDWAIREIKNHRKDSNDPNATLYFGGSGKGGANLDKDHLTALMLYATYLKVIEKQPIRCANITNPKMNITINNTQVKGLLERLAKQPDKIDQDAPFHGLDDVIGSAKAIHKNKRLIVSPEPAPVPAHNHFRKP